MVLQDLRHAIRTLWKSPGLTAAAVLTLGLGIGATSAVFSVINGVLLRPLPLPEPERLAVVWGYHPEIGTETASLPDFLDWRDQSRSFQHLAAYFRQNYTLTGGDKPERIRGARVTRGYFELMGVKPELGRLFADEEDQANAASVLVLSHGVWRRRFGGDPTVVGRTIRLDGEPYEIIGVAAQNFDFPNETEVWRPLAIDPAQVGRRSDFLTVLGRLADDAGMGAAQQEMETIMAHLEEDYPGTNAGWSARVVPLHEELVGSARPRLLVLVGAVVLVLLIACANVANLLLVRSSTRHQELAVRAALGASQGRLARQLLSESAVLAASGGLLGLLLAVASLYAFRTFGPPELPRLDTVSMDGTVLAFTAAAAILTGLLFGLAPALQTARRAIYSSLKPMGRAAGVASQTRLRSILAGAQVALAIVLLIGAGLLIRSLDELGRTDAGFETEGLFTLEVDLPGSKYPEDPHIVAFFDRLIERVSALSGVIRVGAISGLPVRDGAPYLSFAVQGRPPVDPAAVQDAEVLVVTPGYFQTTGIPLRQGRLLAAQDQAEGELVVLINERMAERYWPGEDPRGAQVTLNDPVEGPWRRIVGVVGNTRQESLQQEPYPQLYIPLTQGGNYSMCLVVRTAGDGSDLLPALGNVVQELDPDLPILRAGSLAEIFSQSLAAQRFNSYMLLIFAAAALGLAGVGLYGVLAFLVSQRTREIGLRMSLGADRTRVFTDILARGSLLVGVGAVVGVALAVAASQLLEALLFGVSPLDPLTYVAVPVFLFLVSLLAMWTPAYRASRVDPVVALREE